MYTEVLPSPYAIRGENVSKGSLKDPRRLRAPKNIHISPVYSKPL